MVMAEARLIKYQAIRKNYSYGKKWEEGEIVDSDTPLNHHFQPIGAGPMLEIPVVSEGMIAPQLKAATKKPELYDPMRPMNGLNGTTSFSQLQGRSPLRQGMAAGLTETPKDLTQVKRPGRPRKT